ncbi:MAG TPA: hypothetical protein PKD26_12730 [Pyrinomonadaceae bacterium]|nr:hypothetical protein [Pyrinomonadaceae bacterium]
MVTSRWLVLVVLVGLVTFTVVCGNGTFQPNDNLMANVNVRKEKVNTVNNPSVDSAATVGIKLECSLNKTEEAIIAKYSIKNGTEADIYVLDAYPSVDENRQPQADLLQFYLSFREPNMALLLKGVPPPPAIPAAKRIMPLGTKVVPGGSVQRELKIPLPLRERSDWYYPPQPPEEYSSSSIQRVTIMIQYLPANVPGFEAMPVHYAPEFFTLKAEDLLSKIETVKKEFEVEKTQILLRKDRFTRL